MALQNFVDNSLPTIKAAWLNSVDLIQNVVTGSAGGIAVTGTLYVSGVSSFAAGSFGAPSIYMTGYATTGWYNIGANNWGFAVSGSKVLDIASTGLVVTGALTGTTTAKFGTGAQNYVLDAYAAGASVVSSLTSDQTEAWLALKASGTTLGHVRIGASGATMFLYAGNTTIGTVSSTGLAVTGTTSTTTGMAVGGATAGAGGIAFPATAVAVVDVNTLDDYEEGTFTPAISAGAGSITASSATGSYTKIGNRVFYEVVLTITTNGTGASSLIFTLPFTAAQQHTPVGVNTSSAETCVGISTTTDVGMRTYNALYPVSSGHVLRVSGNYIV